MATGRARTEGCHAFCTCLFPIPIVIMKMSEKRMQRWRGAPVWCQLSQLKKLHKGWKLAGNQWWKMAVRIVVLWRFRWPSLWGLKDARRQSRLRHVGYKSRFLVLCYFQKKTYKWQFENGNCFLTLETWPLLLLTPIWRSSRHDQCGGH